MSAIDLTGKRAFVTGAAHGIGRACAIALAQDGAELVLNDLPSQWKALQATAREAGGSPRLLERDVFKESGREPLVVAAGPIDIFVSCPYRTVRKPFLELTLRDCKSVIDATFISHAHMTQLVARRMVAAKRPGSIILIGSIYGMATRTGSVLYDAAKAALHHLVPSVAMELAPHHIRVNAIAPGYTDTPGERKIAEEEGADIQVTAKRLPMKRLVPPEEIGRTAAFLASDQALMLNGRVVVVDGLMSLCDFGYAMQGDRHD